MNWDELELFAFYFGVGMCIAIGFMAGQFLADTLVPQLVTSSAIGLVSFQYWLSIMQRFR